jgi:branched-chain amino acid transport system substrate-binding protein
MCATILRSFVVCLSILGISSCSHTPKKEGTSQLKPFQWAKKVEKIQTEAVKVAVLLPFSGPHKNLGHSLLKGAELGLFDANVSQLTLIPVDTKGTEEGARLAAQKAISEGAQLILGPLFSHETRSIASLPNTPPVLSFSTDLSVTKPLSVFVLGLDAAEQLQRLLVFAGENDVKRIAVLLPKNAYGDYIQKILEVLKSSGIAEVVYKGRYDGNSLDLSRASQDLKALSYDGLLIPEGGERLSHLISSLRYHDVPLEDVRLLGTGQWDSAFLTKTAGISGGWFSAPPLQEREIFSRRYQGTFGIEPHRLSSLAYDAILMAASLVKSHNGSPFQWSNLIQKEGFWGSEGLFRLTPSGDTERGLAVFEVADRGMIRLISPAPESFG